MENYKNWYPAPLTEIQLEWQQIIKKHLGFPGTMLGSKTNLNVVYNGNIIVENRKLWFGDINLKRNKEKLQKCADEIGGTLYILREMDARFDKENKPDLSNPVAIINPLCACGNESLQDGNVCQKCSDIMSL